jgi:hypothetical protein
MKVSKLVKHAVSKLLGKEAEALKAIAEFLFSGSTKQSLTLHFNIFSVSVKAHILNCLVAKKPIPPAGAQKFMTALGHVAFGFYSVNNTVKLPEQVYILLARQFVVSPAIEINTYLCVAPRQVYEALKSEIKDGFDEFETLIEKLKREVKRS